MQKNILRKTAVLMAGALAAASLAGCSGSGTAATTAAETEAEETKTPESTVQDTQAAETGATSETETESEAPVQTEPLIVYLNDFDALIPELFKEATGYDVEVVVGNGAETMSRIAAEKGNPQWDVVWIDSMYDVYSLGAEGELLTGWEPENAANLTEFAEQYVPENKCFYPTGAHAAATLVYRNDVYSEDDAPKTFAELTDAKYAGTVGMADPGVAAPAYPLAAYFMDTLGLEGGKDYFQQLFDNGLKVYPKNPQVVQALASSEITVAMLQESNAYDMKASGEPITIIWPEDGAPASVRVAAISGASDQMEIAKIFVNFLLEPKTQQALVDSGDEGYFEPSVEGVSQKEGRDENAKLVAADIEFGSENEADIKAWFADMSVQ